MNAKDCLGKINEASPPRPGMSDWLRCPAVDSGQKHDK
jgi:hypothetical protein